MASSLAHKHDTSRVIANPGSLAPLASRLLSPLLSSSPAAAMLPSCPSISLTQTYTQTRSLLPSLVLSLSLTPFRESSTARHADPATAEAETCSSRG